jgi:hypothetical protein
MPEWLSKAQATITGGRSGADEFQPFERTCVCGEILCGERTLTPQQIVCPRCERAWFILPRDPYPRPKARRAKASLWKRWTGSSSGKEGGTASPRQKSSGVSQQTASMSSDRTRELPKRASAPPLRQRIATGLSSGKTAARERLRRSAKPMRLIGAGMLVALVATGFWLWHRARVDAASATIVSVEPQAEQALVDRDFATAEKHFAELAAAVDTLGATDQTAERVRQRYRETVALNNLAAQSPFDLAAEAEKLASNPDEWAARFKAISAGRWVVLDVNVAPAEPASDNTLPAKGNDENEEKSEPAEPHENLVVLDMPLVVGKIPVRFVMEPSLFKRVKLPTRAIFAAQYESWNLKSNGKEPAAWVVRFRPGTAFLWASSDTYAALGFDLDAPAAPPRSVLEHQAKLLGLEPEPAGPKLAEATPETARKP